LAVFGGQPLDYDAAAMAAVWQADEEQALDLRLALVDAGLVETAQASGGTRYALHQVIAAFADARLALDPGEKRATALRHAQHYGGVWGGYDKALSAGLMTYDAPLEWENGAVALERLAAWSASDDEAAAILLDYARSWRNVLTNNYDPRRMGWLEAAVAAAQRVGDPRDQATTLQAIGDVQNFRKDMDAALASYRQALDLFRSVGSRLGEANTLLAQGDILRSQHSFAPAWEHYTQVAALYAAIGDRYSLARVLYRMGDWHAAQEQRQPAAELYRQAIDLWRSIGVDDLVDSILLPRLRAVT
ncbi:MAG: tetratricopeptide repeat protein, partial [Anaerolineae bacterium]